MRKLVLLLVMIALKASCFSQSTGSIRGRVTDQLTNEALTGATVNVKGTNISAITNNEGYFVLPNLAAGNGLLVISFVGYATIEVTVNIIIGNATIADVALTFVSKIGNDIVISASQRPEKITQAPASVRIIDKKELEQFSGSNVYELASKLQGVEFVRSGIDYVALNARGFNRAGNTKILQIVDGRNTMSPVSTGLPMYNYSTVNKEDVERMEIVLGPQSALYGPNAHNAVFNTIMKDPRKCQGTTVSVSGGNHYQFSGRLRHAMRINNKWAYKLTGEYTAGKDFIFYDTVYAGGSVFGDPVAIPERNVNFDFRRIRGEAHLYYSVTPQTDIIISSGMSHNNSLGVTNGGRNQMRGVKPGFLQARLVHRNYFITVYNTWGNLGTSYAIAPYTRDYWNRTHSTVTNCDSFPNSCLLSPDEAEKYALRNQFQEKNQRLNAEGQYNHSFKKAGLFLVGGFNYQKEKPNSFGTTLVDKDRRIYITQIGGVVQLEKTLRWNLRFIGAARLDNHSNYGSFFSPKLALTKAFGENNFRITWAKAYAMPSILFQYSNQSGVTFGNGPGVKYVPNGSTDSEEFLVSTTSLKPEEISTWEIGYKGIAANKLYIDINCYLGVTKNFLSPSQPVDGKAYFLGDIPLTPSIPGRVVNGTLTGARFNTYFNYGDVRAYGVDMGTNYSFNRVISLALRYSWFGSDITKDNKKNDANKDGYVSLEEKSLNAPRHKGVAILDLQNLCKERFHASLAVQFVEQYDFYSGNQIGTAAGKGTRGEVYWGSDPVTNQPRYYVKNFDWGPLGGFATFDLNAGYKFDEMISMNIGITNLFNTTQREFVGSPSIGRLILAELKVHVPNVSRK